MAGSRAGIGVLWPKSKAVPGQIWLFDQIATPKIAPETGYVSPTVNLLYGLGFADLGPEPYILTTPNSDGTATT